MVCRAGCVCGVASKQLKGIKGNSRNGAVAQSGFTGFIELTDQHSEGIGLNFMSRILN